MILHNINSPSSLEQSIQAFWLYFKGKILDLTNTQWNEEDYKGISFYQWRTMQYYNLLYLLILIQVDISQNGGTNSSWGYYRKKYDLDRKRDCFICEGIDFDKALNLFSFPVIESEGVGNFGVQVNLGIETRLINPNPLASIDLKALLANPRLCTNKIVELCN